MAESNGRITRAQREAMMGHEGIDPTYNLGKPLHPEILEEMRAAYQRASEFLESGNRTDRVAGQERLLRLVLLGSRIPKEVVDKLDLTTLTEEGLDRLLIEFGASGPPESKGRGTSAATVPGENPAPPSSATPVVPRQRVVPVGDAPRLIESGYEYMGPLGADRVVLRVPEP
jgi:hypothetical protein